MTFREDHARIVRIEADSIAGMVQCILRRSHFGITNLADSDRMNTFRRWAEKSRFWDRLYIASPSKGAVRLFAIKYRYCSRPERREK